MKNIIKIIIITLLSYLIYSKKILVSLGVLKSMEVFNESLFPSIFPIMILSDLILSTNLINLISNSVGKLFSKVFKISKAASYVFFLSCFSGCPSNAKYIKDLLDNKIITNREAEKVLSMSVLYNPLLIVALTKYLCFRDSILLIVFNIISNIVIGVINRGYKVKINNYEIKPKRFNLIDSISNAINTLILLFGVITTFNILNNIMPFNHPLITGIFEITSALNLLNVFPISYSNKLLYTAILLAFSGLSIIMQIKSIFRKDTLDYSLFYRSRIIHIVIMILLVKIFL